MQRVAVGVLAMIAVGCNPWDFVGDDGNLAFTSNLRRPHRAWTPDTPIAVGSRIEITAVGLRGDAGLVGGAPDAAFLVEDGGLLDEAAVTGAALTAVVKSPGTQTLRWTGEGGDRFTISTRDPSTVRLRDPVLQLAAVTPDGGIVHGAPWQDIGNPFLLLPGPPLRLDVTTEDETGALLASSFGLTTASADDGGLSVEHIDPYARVRTTAPDGATGEIALRIADGGPVMWGVRTASVQEIARLELTVVEIDPKKLFGIKATALTADGGAVWQPPVTWEFSDGWYDSLVVDGGVRQPFLDGRTDIRVLDWKREGTPGDQLQTVAANLGTLRAEAQVAVNTPGTTTTPDEEPTCLCDSTRAPSGWLWMALGVAALRRARRQR